MFLGINIEKWKALITSKFSGFATTQFNQRLYSLKSTSDCKMKESFLYMYALSTWQQNADGSTGGLSNYMTQEELLQIINRIQEL